MSSDILLEIGTEEIPAGYLPPVIEQLKTISEAELKSARLLYKNINIWATPRRLILHAESVAEQQISTETEISGPPGVSAFINGAPTDAAFGFAKKYGVDVSELIVKNGRACILKKEPSLKTETVLPEVFKRIISTLSFPKTMVWEPSRFRFVRPIRRLLALYGKKTIKFQIADVKSSNLTCARFGKKIKITEPKKFTDILRNKSVLINQIDRLDALKKTVTSSIRNKGEISAADQLFETVNNMVEFPTAVLCEFNKKFLNLPEKIIANTVKKQKNFVIIDGKTKKILTYFVGVKDGISTNMEIIRDGYEKVITARLEDAEFYFKNDTKTKLEEKIERLKGIVFQEKLGTIYDKVQRVRKLAIWLSHNLSIFQSFNSSVLERICLLCKADLSTETVAEFPELQGAFGKICAVKDGEDRIVADAIEQHWWPVNYEGQIPDSIEASVVSIADKIDTLAGDFAIGLTPTGSADPYGLRRAAYGIVKIAVEKKVSFSIKELIIQSIKNLPLKVENEDRIKVMLQLEDFIKQRLDTYLKEKDILQDEIDSVLSVRLVDIPDAFNRAVAIHSIRKLPDFEPIAVSFKRIGNILKQAEKMDGQAQKLEANEELIKEPEEKNLLKAFKDIRIKADAAIKSKDYELVLQGLVSLRSPIDKFFEKVLIMDKNEKIKQNRLGLLFLIHCQFTKIADFSKIVTEKKNNSDV